MTFAINRIKKTKVLGMGILLATFSYAAESPAPGEGLPMRIVPASGYVHPRNFSDLEDRASSLVVSYPAPAGSPVAENRKARLIRQGKSYEIPLYETPVWGGKAYHGSVDCNGEAEIEIEVSGPQIASAVVRPLSKGAKAVITGNKVRFSIPGPSKWSVELNGELDEAIHLFINPIERNAPKESSDRVVYFGPGYYDDVGILKPQSGTTYYVAGGAYLRKARFDLKQCENVTVRGRGVIDTAARLWDYKKNGSNYHCLSTYDATNITVEGLTFLDSGAFCTVYRRTQDLRIRNVKIIGKNGNTDQNDLVGSRRVHVSDVFLRGYDDGIAVKVAQEARDLESSDILVENAVIWTDLAHPLTVGTEILNTAHHIVFSNVDILHVREPAHNSRALAIHCGDYGTVHDIIFTDIRIENFSPPFANGGIDLVQLEIKPNVYSKTKMPGYIRNITFRNVTLVSSPFKPQIQILGFDENHTIENILFDSVVAKGKRLDSVEDAEFVTNAFVKNIRFTPGAAK